MKGPCQLMSSQQDVKTAAPMTHEANTHHRFTLSPDAEPHIALLICEDLEEGTAPVVVGVDPRAALLAGQPMVPLLSPIKPGMASWGSICSLGNTASTACRKRSAISGSTIESNSAMCSAITVQARCKMFRSSVLTPSPSGTAPAWARSPHCADARRPGGSGPGSPWPSSARPAISRRAPLLWPGPAGARAGSV